MFAYECRFHQEIRGKNQVVDFSTCRREWVKRFFYQNVSDHFIIFQIILEYFRSFQNVLDHFRMLQIILEYFRSFQNVPDYSKMLQIIIEYPSLFYIIPDHSRMVQNVQSQYQGLIPNIQSKKNPFPFHIANN